jgi:hypothetical protein
MELFEEIPLSNNLKVEVWNQSRSIASDTTKVDIYIRLKVDLKPSYFAEHKHYEKVRDVFGPEIIFEYRMERAYVNNREKDTVFRELLETFKKDTLPYLSNPIFPRNLARSKYRDIEKNPYKYSTRLQDPST